LQAAYRASGHVDRVVGRDLAFTDYSPPRSRGTASRTVPLVATLNVDAAWQLRNECDFRWCSDVEVGYWLVGELGETEFRVTELVANSCGDPRGEPGRLTPDLREASRLERCGRRVIGFLHTHPFDPAPSQADMRTFANLAAGLKQHVLSLIATAADGALMPRLGPYVAVYGDRSFRPIALNIEHGEDI
jgi:proteasome lid subunit RPN8/RPN11